MKLRIRFVASLLILSIAVAAADEPSSPEEIGEKEMARLRIMLKSPDRKKALETIKQRGPAAIGLLGDVCAATVDRKEENRRAAVEAIEAIDADFFRTVEPVIMDANWGARIQAVKKLDPKKMDLRPMMLILQYRLHAAESIDETYTVLWAMVRIAPEDGKVADAVLTNAEKHLSQMYCQRWLELIPELERDQKATKRAVNVLEAGLRHKNSEVRITAMECLARLGADAKGCLPELRKRQGGGSQKERDAARATVGTVERSLENPTDRGKILHLRKRVSLVEIYSRVCY